MTTAVVTRACETVALCTGAARGTGARETLRADDAHAVPPMHTHSSNARARSTREEA